MYEENGAESKNISQFSSQLSSVAHDLSGDLFVTMALVLTLY